MPRTRVLLEPGWVLATRSYRESSRLLEVLTRSRGRVGIVARGVSRPRSHWRGLLEAFQPLALSWVVSGELGTLTAAEALAPAVPLAGERIFLGWYLNELLLRLLARNDPQPRIHAAYGETLPRLVGSGTGSAVAAALRGFEVELLAALGYGLPLPDGLDPRARYAWDPEQGPAPADGEGGFSGAALVALREGRYDEPATRREVQALLRMAIDRQLAGRELKSRRLLRAVRAGRGGT
ncbi:MAG TPA: DNA repair protein RecO [Nevskiaceae bacterium]